eukprot:5378852-Pleurochrysis_carterae.AAC.1
MVVVDDKHVEHGTRDRNTRHLHDQGEQTSQHEPPNGMDSKNRRTKDCTDQPQRPQEQYTKETLELEAGSARAGGSTHATGSARI